MPADVSCPSAGSGPGAARRARAGGGWPWAWSVRGVARVSAEVDLRCPVVAGVRLSNVSKRFGEVTAVDNVVLDIGDREFMVLLGPSGCGKSTLLRMIAGLEDPTEGEIWIGEQLVNDVAPKQRDIAMVFQSYALYPHKTVQANIEFPLKARGVGGPASGRTRPVTPPSSSG